MDISRDPNQQRLQALSDRGLEASQELARWLDIKTPEDAVKAPPILAFQRKREVEIPWGQRAPAEALRAHFESSWGLQPDADWPTLSAQLKLMLVPVGAPPAKVLELFTANPAQADKPASVKSGIALREGASGRLYLLKGREAPLTAQDFETEDSYRALWQQKKVGEIELAFATVAEASRFFTAYEEIDLRPAAICRRYKDLAAQLELVQTTLNAVRGERREKIAEHTTNLVKAILDKKADQSDLERYHDWVHQLQLAEYDAARRIDRLAADAAQLGYYLHTEADTPDKARLKGSLYVVHLRKAQWTNTVRVARHWLLPWLWMTVSQPYETMVEVYQKVDPNKDLLAEKRKALYSDASNPGQRLFVFEQTASGFVTNGGAMTLGEVMRRCGEDEAFRRSCVVALPVYEESLTGERMLTKYSLFVRPLPGLVPAMPPRLSLVESLTYRLAWKETQIGELASSINLAPGEERQITISKHFEQETTLTRTSSSIFDVSRTDSSDLATEMENQTRQEQEHSSNLEMETRASGGWGPFSAEASAKAGTSTSLKSMSQALSKVAKKASQSVSQQNRQEISTSSSARTKITNVEETVAKIRNINQGRSLNLMFYRLYNKYEGGLFLEDLHFELVPGVETIAGSGVHESRRYDLDDLATLSGSSTPSRRACERRRRLERRAHSRQHLAPAGS
jgi:hypothetical protein